MPQLRPGSQFGRFHVLALLGQGGMGEVYRVQDAQLGREVALKLSHTALDGARRERFLREAEVAAKLRHPGIVALHEVATVQGRLALIYALVHDAQPLDQAFRRLDLRRRVELVRDAAAALGHAHAHGVFHRDVKPDNLLVDAQGAVRVADFGLAAGEEYERLTRTGALLGTPSYMAPEQIDPARGAVGPPCDVWALGAVLYEAIGGQVPFRAPSLSLLVHEILHANPAALPDVGALGAICRRALAKSPRARYATARELAVALDAWLQDGAAGRARPWGRLALLSGLATLAVALGWSRLTPTPGSAPPATDVASPTSSLAVDTEVSDPKVAAAAWRTIRRERDPSARLRAAWSWLQANPGQLFPAEAQRSLLTLSREHPLSAFEVVSGDRACVAWSGDTLLAAGPSTLEVRTPLGEREGQRGLVIRFSPRALLALPRGDGVAIASDQTHLVVLRGSNMNLSGLEAPIQSLAASPDGRWLAVGSREGAAIQVYDAEAVKLAHTLEVLDQVTTDLAFSHDGRSLVASMGTHSDMGLGSGGHLRVWDTSTWELRGTCTTGSYPEAFAFSPDGATLLLGTYSGHVSAYGFPLPSTLLDAAERRLVRAPPEGADWRQGTAHQGWVHSVAVSPRGDRVYTLGEHPTQRAWNDLIVWSWPDGELLWRRELAAQVSDLALSDDGTYLALSDVTGRVEVLLVRLD